MHFNTKKIKIDTCLIFLALHVPIASAGDDPNDYDEPRTELMNLQVIRGELVLGIEAMTAIPSLGGQVQYTGVSPHFNWNGMLEVNVPLKTLSDVDFRSIDLIAGGRWVFRTKSVPEEGNISIDKQLGVGVEVLSFESSSQGSDLGFDHENLPEGLNPEDMVRNSLRAVVASLGWTKLRQSENDKSQVMNTTLDLGVGKFGVEVPEKGGMDLNGKVIHARFLIHVYDHRGSIRCSFTHASAFGSDGSQAQQFEMMGSAKLLEDGNLNAFTGVEYSKVSLDQATWEFNGETGNGIRSQMLRFFIGLGYTF